MKNEVAVSKPIDSKVAKCNVKKIEHVKGQIMVVRGHRVLLDADLAKLYGVTTKRLNQQFRRNPLRFPDDFAFQLTLAEAKEVAASRLQNATLNRGHNIKHAPHVFTEHGAIMLASVLNSKVAVQASIYIVRAFVQMRTAMLEYADLSHRVDELAASCDDQFQEVFIAIRNLMAIPNRSRRTIGFVSGSNKFTKQKSL